MNDLFLRIFKHLLPNGRAWRITADKTLRDFMQGLTGIGVDSRAFIDRAYLDLWPGATRELSTWGDQFALPDPTREQIVGAWQALGGQDPKYIQSTLRAAGFDVYVHDWWEPESAPAIGVQAQATARNPLLLLRPSSDATALMVECGEPEAQCGNEWAESGNRLNPIGYPLVNKVSESLPWQLTLAGGPYSRAGEAEMLAANYTQHRDYVRDYVLPSDALLWPYFLYIGGAEFGTMASIPQERQAEFEALALKLAPTHLWIGVLVEYT